MEKIQKEQPKREKKEQPKKEQPKQRVPVWPPGSIAVHSSWRERAQEHGVARRGEARSAAYHHGADRARAQVSK